MWVFILACRSSGYVRQLRAAGFSLREVTKDEKHQISKSKIGKPKL